MTDDITWWQNTSGDGTAWAEHTVDGGFAEAISVYAADVDGDGDLDVLGAAYDDYDITWWESRWVIAGDLDSDGGVDSGDLYVLCEQWLLEELSADVWPQGGDGIVNFFDWAVFANEWQITPDYEALADFAEQWLKTGANYYIADIAPSGGGDGIVNMLDLAVLASDWLIGE